MTGAQWKGASAWGQMTSDKYQLYENVLGCVSIFWRAIHVASTNVKLLLVCIDFATLFFFLKETESDSRLSWIASQLFIWSTHFSQMHVWVKKNNCTFFSRLLFRNTAWEIQYAAYKKKITKANICARGREGLRIFTKVIFQKRF